MAQGFSTQLTGWTSLYYMGLQSPNLKDYMDSYLLMSGGAALIIVGVFMAIRFYIKEKKERTTEVVADLNRQIKEATQTVYASEEYYSSGENHQPEYAATLDMDTTLVEYQDDNDETALIDRDLDETAILDSSSLSSLKSQKPDPEETVFIMDGGNR